MAACLGVPNVTKSFGALLPPERVAAAGDRVAPLWVAHRQEPRPYGGMYEHLYLDIYPSSLQPSEWPHIRVRQPLRPSGLSSKGEHELPALVTESPSTPLVYVTLGTVFSNNAALSAVVEATWGLPQVCLPQAADQFLNAAACDRSGTGITVAPGEAAEQITAALGRVLSEPSFRTAAEQVSGEIAAMPSPHEVAELLRSRYG